MYAFPRRSVGTRNISHPHPDLVDPPSGAAAGYALAAPSPPQGGEICLSLFPCSRVGTRNPGLVDPPSGAAAGYALAAPSPPQGGRDLLVPVPMLPRGNKNGQRNVCIPTQERGNENNLATSIPKTPATSVTLTLALLIPPLALLRAAPLPRLLPLKGGEICLSLFPCSRVGTGMVSVMYAFPRRSVGTRNISHPHPDLVDPPSGAAAGYALAAPSPPQGGRDLLVLFPCSRVGTRNGQCNVCIPTQERGNEKKTPATSVTLTLALLIPPLALLRATPLPRLLPLRGGEICLSLFPCSRVGTRMVSVMYAFPRRSVGTRKSMHSSIPKTPGTSSHPHPGLVDPPSGAAAGYALAAPSPPQGGEICLSLFPCSRVGTRMVSVMYAFPRRSVGTRKQSCNEHPKNSCNISHPHPGLVDPPSGAAAGCALAAPSPPQGGRDLLVLVPMLPRGNKNGQRNVCIPTQERGNEKPWPC